METKLQMPDDQYDITVCFMKKIGLEKILIACNYFIYL